MLANTNRFSLYIIRIKLIVVLNAVLFSIVTSTEIFSMQLITDLQNHFNTNWIIFHSCKKFQHAPRIISEFKNEAKVFISVYDWHDLKSFYMILYKFSYVRPLILFSCRFCENDCLLKVSFPQ